MNTEYWLVLITFGKKTKILRRNKADYMGSWKDNVDRKLIEWTEFSFQDIFKSNRSIYSFASESFWRSILWMLRLNFTLQISRHVLFRESLAGFPIVAWLNFKQFKLKTVLQANSCVVEQQTSNLLLFEYMYNVFWENLLSLTKGGSTNQ